MGQAVSAISWGGGRLDIFALASSDHMVRHKAWTGRAWDPPEPGGWQVLGRLVSERAVAAATWGRDRIDIFGVGQLHDEQPDRRMIHQAYDGQWRRTEELGGLFNSPPAAVSWGLGRLDIFALGLDNQMFHKAWNGGPNWLPSNVAWEALGEVFSSPPAVVSWAPGRLDIFAVDTRNQLRHKAWDGGPHWFPSDVEWEQLGGPISSSPPAVVSWAPGRLDIFALERLRFGRPSQMLHKAWDGGPNWFPSNLGWEKLGGGFNSPPAAVSWAPGRLDVFALGLDNQMFHKAWDGGPEWFPSNIAWEALGGVFSSPPAAVAWGRGRLDIFAVDTDRQMRHKAWAGGPHWFPSDVEWEQLGGPFATVQ